MKTFILPFLLILIYTRNDPFSQLIKHQQKQRLTAQMDTHHYHLLPFLLHSNSDFVTNSTSDEELRVEIVVHWVQDILVFPSFNFTHKIRITIDEHCAYSRKIVLNRQFLTQTGFKIYTKANTQYRWKIQSHPDIIKMVQIAIQYVSPMQTQKRAISPISQKTLQLFKQLSLELEAKQKLVEIRQYHQLNHDQKYKWMTIVETSSLLLFVAIQVAYIEKLVLRKSIV